jgi:hypothetical protein
MMQFRNVTVKEKFFSALRGRKYWDEKEKVSVFAKGFLCTSLICTRPEGEEVGD